MTELHILGPDVVTDQCQDLLMKTDDLSSLRSAFKHIHESIKDGDVERENIPRFVENIESIIKSHCCDIARNFPEEIAGTIEAECEEMSQWLSTKLVPAFFKLSDEHS